MSEFVLILIITFFTMLTIILLVILLFCLLYYIVNFNNTAVLIKKIPGPKDRFLVGNAVEIMVAPVDLFVLGRVWAATFKDIYRFYSYPHSIVNIYSPEDVEIVTSNMKYHEKSSIYKFLKPWLADGLLLSKGSKWQQRRKVLTSAFHFNILQKYYSTIDEHSQRLVKVLEETNGQAVDIVPIMSEYTLNTICESAMGVKLDDESTFAGKSYKESIHKMALIILQRFSNVFLHFDFVYNLTLFARKQQKYLSVIHNFTKNVIRNRRIAFQNINISQKKSDEDIYFKKKDAMLDLLLSAEKDHLIDGNGIQEEVDTFTFEGHDTTQSGLTFCILLLACEEFAQEKAYEEQENIFNNTTRAATFNDLSSMNYLECCIKESLRLYPPVPFISRRLPETTTLSNYTIPAETLCNIHIVDLHRREDIYKNALKFDPDRFLPENCVGRHNYAYIPFSAGPRNCIGQKFAIMEMKSALSSIIRNFKLVPVTTPSDIKLLADVVLRSSGPVHVKFIKRVKLARS